MRCGGAEPDATLCDPWQCWLYWQVGSVSPTSNIEVRGIKVRGNPLRGGACRRIQVRVPEWCKSHPNTNQYKANPNFNPNPNLNPTPNPNPEPNPNLNPNPNRCKPAPGRYKTCVGLLGNLSSFLRVTDLVYTVPGLQGQR